MLTAQQKEIVRRDLAKCATAQEVFDYLSNNFDLSAPLGSITKPIFIEGVMKGITMLNAKPKK